jgi:hypothetical protein
MAQADEVSIDGIGVPPVSASYVKGRSIVEEYDMQFELEHATIPIYDDKRYHVQIVFDYESPKQL